MRCLSKRPTLEVLEARNLPALPVLMVLADHHDFYYQEYGDTRLSLEAAGLEVAVAATTTTPIDITDDVKIVGPGASLIQVNGNQLTRLFDINDNNLVATINVSIRKLTLADGHAGAGDGGAIYSDEHLTLARCIVRHNQAANAGAIRQDSIAGSLTIDRCQFFGNHSQDEGGAIWATGPLVARRSRFSDNQASTGGAISSSVDTTLENCTITGNLANSASGGGLRLTGDVTILRSTIAGNLASFGGGLALFGATATIADSTISGNFAASIGGGVMCGVGTELTLRNATVSANAASGNGGGLYVATTAAAATLQNCTIAYNFTDGNGGGIYADRDVNVRSTIVARNFATAGGQDLFSNNLGLDEFQVEFSLLFNDDPAFATINPTIPGSNIGGDPKLGPLQNNGGPTLTHALLPGSPAINAGSNPGSELFDQRGPSFKRVKGSQADIGAFER